MGCNWSWLSFIRELEYGVARLQQAVSSVKSLVEKSNKMIFIQIFRVVADMNLPTLCQTHIANL